MPSSKFVGSANTKGTRERILDVALRLFTEQGYEGTSLREIAEQLGVTKAALYYHFGSKDEILVALHRRLHELGSDALARLGEGPVTVAAWGALLNELINQVLEQRPLFLLHQRNEAAIEKLHNPEHDADHDDLRHRLRQVLTDPALSVEDRVRMAASVGVVFSGILLSPEAFTSNEELGSLLRTVLANVLSPDAGTRGPSSGD